MGANNSRLPDCLQTGDEKTGDEKTGDEKTDGKKTSGNFHLKDKDIRRLWSYNSGSGTGRYVCIKFKESDCKSYVVTATGDVEGENEALTDITFHAIGKKNRDPPCFQLQFKKYYLTASEEDHVVVAVDRAKDATSFDVINLLEPNNEFCVFKSDVVKGKDKKKKEKPEYLYLSSDGAGNMKLKVWNKPIPEMRDASLEVDPALLFRIVRPHEKT